MLTLMRMPAELASSIPWSTVARSPPRAMLRNAAASRVSSETFNRAMPASTSTGSLRSRSWPLVVRLISSRPSTETSRRKVSSLGLTRGSPPVIRSRSMPAASIR
ncbi:hypothetical protein D3C81_1791640 [compost metagenome]